MSEDQDTVAMKLAVIDAACGIKSLEEPALFKRLEELYIKGFRAGIAGLEPVLQDMVTTLGSMAGAHVVGNRERVDALLAEFCAQRVIVKFGHDQQQAVH